MQHLLYALVLAPAHAAPADLAARWEAVAQKVASHSAIPVPFGPDDVADLQRGRTVARRYDTEQGAYATGAIYVEAPIEAVWVAINDAPHDPPSRVSVERLPSAPGQRLVYMKLDLPFPLADRQWVADVRGNAALFGASEGAVWQRQWTLGDRALAPTPDDGAVWINENRGAWTLLDLGEGTLVLFSVRTVLGGVVPASIAQSWAAGTLRGGLERLAERAVGMRSHYVAGHETVLNPTGSVVPTW